MKLNFDLLDDEMEGVKFNAEVDDATGKVTNVVVDPAFDDDYWDNFNKPKYLRAATKSLEEVIAEYPTVGDFYKDCVGPGCSIQSIP